MLKYISKRLLQLIPILLGLTFLTFALMYIAPGDPASMKLKAQGIAPTDEMLAHARDEMGLNDPFLTQYGRWLSGALRGDLGTSYKDGTKVIDKMVRATKYTVILAVSAIVLSVAVSVPLGILSAVRHDRLVDYLIRFITFIGNSLPRFLVAVLLMYVLCVRWKLLPVMANGTIRGLLLPTIAMSLGMSCDFIRQLRAEILEQMSQGYVIGERARGDRERIILIKNVLHNSMITLLTLLGLSIAGLMGGSVVVETIFMWPGLGKMVMDAITNRDYPVIQGFVMWMSTIYILINLLTDVSYRWLDPRIQER